MASVIITSIALFAAAALLELHGAYMIWQWRREDRGGWLLGLGGAGFLFLYGILQTLQPASFSRVFAAYGGIFIIASMVWGFVIDRKRPDRLDLVGAGIVLVGIALLMYAPR